MRHGVELFIFNFMLRAGLRVAAPVNVPRVELVVRIVVKSVADHVHPENNRFILFNHFCPTRYLS